MAITTLVNQLDAIERQLDKLSNTRQNRTCFVITPILVAPPEHQEKLQALQALLDNRTSSPDGAAPITIKVRTGRYKYGVLFDTSQVIDNAGRVRCSITQLVDSWPRVP